METKKNVQTHDDNGKWAKGNPGGPGRPKGRRNYAMIYADALEEYAKLNGKTSEEIENIILQVALKQAAKGDYSFYKDVQDRLHGKPMQPTDITSDGKPLILDSNVIEKYEVLDDNAKQDES